MLKKDLIKKIVELEKDNREIVDTFLKALRLINKDDIKMEISPAVKEWCAYDIRIAKSKRLKITKEKGDQNYGKERKETERSNIEKEKG